MNPINFEKTNGILEEDSSEKNIAKGTAHLPDKDWLFLFSESMSFPQKLPIKPKALHFLILSKSECYAIKGFTF